jgi:hypothetical protein
MDPQHWKYYCMLVCTLYHKVWLQAMAVYIWPPDNKEVKTRVVTAMGLLVSAKVMLYSLPSLQHCVILLYTVLY